MYCENRDQRNLENLFLILFTTFFYLIKLSESYIILFTT